MTTETLAELAAEAWQLHRRTTAANPPVRVTRPSAPVLYFGDLDAYRTSPIRIVTVGVNPSDHEFPTSSPWSRFPLEEFAKATVDFRAHAPAYFEVLNGYFRRGRNPYDEWFQRSYEPVLNGMDASYYGGNAVTAIHTDLCSPLPTSPTWRLLEPREQAALADAGVSLWHRLIKELEPQVLLASLSELHLARIKLPKVRESRVFYTVEQQRPCRISARRVRAGGCEAVLVFGAAATRPFQMITDDDKRAVGALARGLLEA